MLSVGTILRGTYRIERYLSSGGFGNTYVAMHTEFNELYAVKEFFMKGVTQRDGDSISVSVSNAANQSQFAEQKEKFKKEARRLFNLDNPHVVKVHDLFEENGTVYYVMDFIDGESLSERLKRLGAPLSEADVNNYLPQILDALECVHSQNIWHLDLKPANIMVDKNGDIKLIDFGASKQIRPDGGATTSTALCYTPGYAPSEQIEQSMEKFGPWTDFYALGATLYKLLTNNEPPKLSDILDGGDVVFSFNSDISINLRKLIIWLMQPNRSKRPQTEEDIRKRFSGDVETSFIFSATNCKNG
jgi:serine/threonine protein kinase